MPKELFLGVELNALYRNSVNLRSTKRGLTVVFQTIILIIQIRFKFFVLKIKRYSDKLVKVYSNSVFFTIHATSAGKT